MHRETLWELLHLQGIPAGIIGLMAGLYSYTVKCGGSISDFFPVTTGVLECSNTFRLHGLGARWSVAVGSSCGTRLATSSLLTLIFADDAVIFAETLEVLELALEAPH